MAAKARTVRDRGQADTYRLSVAGYKSVRDTTSMRLRPLTLVAGANSSGKSSFMQPFLLLKQTLESSFDPGALMIYGPNVQHTDWVQTLSHREKGQTDVPRNMEIGLAVRGRELVNKYEWTAENGLTLCSTNYRIGGKKAVFGPSSTRAQVMSALRNTNHYLITLLNTIDKPTRRQFTLAATRDRCFYEPALFSKEPELRGKAIGGAEFSSPHRKFLTSILHVPGLRGNPLRTYNSSAVKSAFPGTMERYVASIVSYWQGGDDEDLGTLQRLSEDLEKLGLTWTVVARKVNDASVELRVGRLPHKQPGGSQDLVNIADVGFGVSQTLPVLVALHVAGPGQVVYIEQPEIHLHPRAQTIMGDLLVDAANRGVVVVAETHSALVLRAVQTAIASGRISNEDVGLNWFSRDPKTGFSTVTEADLDKLGRFGEWPIDFDEVVEQSDWSYVEAVQRATHDQ